MEWLRAGLAAVFSLDIQGHSPEISDSKWAPLFSCIWVLLVYFWPLQLQDSIHHPQECSQLPQGINFNTEERMHTECLSCWEGHFGGGGGMVLKMLIGATLPVKDWTGVPAEVDQDIHANY